jgi:hypothetical protein
MDQVWLHGTGFRTASRTCMAAAASSLVSMPPTTESEAANRAVSLRRLCAAPLLAAGGVGGRCAGDSGSAASPGAGAVCPSSRIVVERIRRGGRARSGESPAARLEHARGLPLFPRKGSRRRKGRAAPGGLVREGGDGESGVPTETVLEVTATACRLRGGGKACGCEVNARMLFEDKCA